MKWAIGLLAVIMLIQAASYGGDVNGHLAATYPGVYTPVSNPEFNNGAVLGFVGFLAVVFLVLPLGRLFSSGTAKDDYGEDIEVGRSTGVFLGGMVVAVIIFAAFVFLVKGGG